MSKKPNIKFVGQQQKFDPDKNEYVSVRREAPEFVIDGGEKIELPKDIARGAYVDEDVKIKLLGLFPADFKEFIPKGAKQ